MSEQASIVPDDAPPAQAARAATRRERTAAIDRIRTLMDFWGITVDDLRSTDTDLTSFNLTPQATVKYRHPVSGAVWNGRGEHPDWLRSALLKEGYRLDELRPESSSPASATAVSPSPTAVDKSA